MPATPWGRRCQSVDRRNAQPSRCCSAVMVQAIPFDRPFTLSEARSLGISRAQVRGALERGEITRVARGLFSLASESTQDVVRTTCAVTEGRMATSFVGAAKVHGLLLPHEPHSSMHSPMTLRSIPSSHRYRLHSLHLAGPAWTAVNLARFQRLPNALVPLDSALRSGVTRDELGSCVVQMAAWPGSARLLQAVAAADARAESALESMARGHCINAQLPLPTLQAEVVARRRRYRLDLLWANSKVVLEIDGIVKYSDTAAIVDEKRRHNDLQAAGYTVLRCGFVNLHPKADVLMAQLHRLVGE